VFNWKKAEKKDQRFFFSMYHKVKFSESEKYSIQKIRSLLIFPYCR